MSKLIVIGGLNELDVIDGAGIGLGVFFQGCKKRCKGCHNPELQSFETGMVVSTKMILNKLNNEWYDSIIFMGGEPLEQKEGLIELMAGAKALNKERWLYTGYNVNEIPPEVFELSSVIIAGEYKEELKTNGFPASSNQVVIDRRR